MNARGFLKYSVDGLFVKYRNLIYTLLFGASRARPSRPSGPSGSTPAGGQEFRTAVEELSRLYRRQERPYAIQASAAGYRLTLKPAFRGLRERLFGGPREARLTVPALDVLSLVAYRQPIARTAIDALRGQDSAAMLRQLVRLGLVAVVPQDGVRSEPNYVTAGRFLELFGLRDLDDLPMIQDMIDVG